MSIDRPNYGIETVFCEYMADICAHELAARHRDRGYSFLLI